MLSQISMADDAPRLRAVGIDPAIINIGIGVVDVFGYRRDVRLVERAEKLHGKGCKELQDIPCDVPHINLLSSEHWDVRSNLGSLAQYSNPKLKELLEKQPSASRKADYSFQVLSPNMYLHKYDNTPSYRDTAARMFGEHPLVHEKYPSLSGNQELPTVLAENQQDQVKNGKFDYRAPVYNVCTAMLSAVRGVDAYRGEYGRVILNHSKKWGIDRKSTSSDLNKTEYGDRKNAAEREMFNLLAANGLTEWIETLESFEQSGYKLDDRADAILICVHYLMDLYDAFQIRDGIKHANAIDPVRGFTKMPSVLKRPLGRDAPKRAPRKPAKKKASKAKKQQERDPALSAAAFEKHLKSRKREREERENLDANPRPAKQPKKKNTPSPMLQEIVDMTKEGGATVELVELDGYISDSFVEDSGVTYEQLMDTVMKRQGEEKERRRVARRRRTQKKSIFMGKLDVKYGGSIMYDHPGQAKIDRFFKRRETEEKEEEKSV